MTERHSKHHHRRETCRGCGKSELASILDLGMQPPANALPENAGAFDSELRFPLDLHFCKNCGLAQLVDVVDPELLFGHYLYLTGMSDTMREHFDSYAASLVEAERLTGSSLVIDIASNDGSLLASFKKRGCRVLGIEPARNIAKLANEAGIETVACFFDEAVAREIRSEYGAASVATANNVLAHVDDPVAFLKGMRELVSPDGAVVVEAPELRHLISGLEYDTIYHEHLSYFSCAALAQIFGAAGLGLLRVVDQGVHGGSFRLIARPGATHSAEVEARIAAEKEAGLADIHRYESFARDVAANGRAIRAWMEEKRAAGQTVAAYGAPAKGNTLLNYAGIGPDLCAFTVDRNPLKAGRFLPGSHIPILKPEAILERMPDYVMILPWNLADEIIVQQSEYRSRGGRFFVPIPEPREVQ